jgi:hypothetical protein
MKLPSFFGSLIAMVLGSVVTLALFLFVWHFRATSTPTQQLVFKAKRMAVVGQMQKDLASAAEAEKSAVMAITDGDSRTYADQARAASARVELRRAELDTLLASWGTPKEKDLLAQFSQAFSQLQRVDNELLDLAVKNTNLKASALAFGPAADALNQMDAALARVLSESADSNAANAKKVILRAADARAAAQRIALLLPPHIAEETDAKMDALEAVMAKEDEQARRDLQELAALLPSNPDAASAASSYARFGELRKQILKLSRENTNVRSLSISLNEKRKKNAICQELLTSLSTAIEEEPIPGLQMERPR